jgi:hypothetical protein
MRELILEAEAQEIADATAKPPFLYEHGRSEGLDADSPRLYHRGGVDQPRGHGLPPG